MGNVIRAISAPRDSMADRGGADCLASDDPDTSGLVAESVNSQDNKEARQLEGAVGRRKPRGTFQSDACRSSISSRWRRNFELPARRAPTANGSD
jgi:hypothetical protein